MAHHSFFVLASVDDLCMLNGQDAAGLAKLSASVEDVFASGDLPRVAETLAQMRRCLAVVGEVPPYPLPRNNLYLYTIHRHHHRCQLLVASC